MNKATFELEELLAWLDDLMIPATLEDAFEAYRFDLLEKACAGLSLNTLTTYTDVMKSLNTVQLRHSFSDIFDPFLGCAHPAASQSPTTAIDLPSLPSTIVSSNQQSNSAIIEPLARSEVDRFTSILSTHTDLRIDELFVIAAAGMADDAEVDGEARRIAYVSLNGSERVRQLLRNHSHLLRVSRRIVSFPDMVEVRRRELNAHHEIFDPPLTQEEMECWTDDQIQLVSGDFRIFSMNPVRHLVFCRACLNRLVRWQQVFAEFQKTELCHRA